MIYQFIVYYGKFPNYFQTYLDSLLVNKDILHILLITDIDTSSNSLPQNISVFKISFDEVKQRAATFLIDEYNLFIETTDILHNHYKLCDFRPIYHKLFKDILDKIGLTSNDYFGWGDCDLVYGKISTFLDISLGYDMIGIHGHFTALRYDEPYISKYKDVKLLLPILLLRRSCYLDEQRFIDVLIPLIKSGKTKYFHTENFFCDIIPEKSDPMKFTNLVKTDDADTVRIIEHFLFDKSTGRLYYIYKDGDLQESFYVHLQKRKMNYSVSKDYSRLMITKDAFLES